MAEELNQFDFTKTKDIERFKAAIALDPDECKAYEQMVDVVVREYGIETAVELHKQLDRIRRLDQALQDLAEPITALQSLTATL